MNRILMTMIALLCVAATAAKADETCYIKHVVNGTTVVTDANDTVKLIGVRAWNAESMSEKDLQDYLEILVGGVQVTMTTDPTISDAGSTKFRYLKVGGTLVNQHLISEGYAEPALEVSFSKAAVFAAAAEAAKMERVGRWAMEDQYAGVELGTNNDEVTDVNVNYHPDQTVDQVLSGVLE